MAAGRAPSGSRGAGDGVASVACRGRGGHVRIFPDRYVAAPVSAIDRLALACRSDADCCAYGASANPQLRAFGIYYAIVLVPSLALGASSGGAIVARRFVPDRRARTWAAAIVALGALLVGSGRAGYSLRPWRADIAAVPEAVSLLGSERVLLVQSGLYPHAGYSPRVQLLTPYGLRDPRNTDAAILIAAEAGGYPFSREELHQLARLPVICQLPAGLVAVRNRRPSVSSLRFVQ
jgi:hypothetical protein